MAKKSDTPKKNDADGKKSSVRYDDFIANVHADPAKPEASIMLAGFVGHGAEGEVRIYPDASLSHWYDVAEGDVVHAMPVPEAKLGGSYVWVRASAQIKPGAAAAAPGTGAVAAARAAMPDTQATQRPECQPYPTQINCCTMAGDACRAVGGWPPSLGCQPSVMACPHAALGAGTVTGFFGCTAACPPAALNVQTNPPTLGCTGGCNALGAAQTFTMGPLCQQGRGGVFTPFGG
jgi:hypothetical protein